MYKPSSSRPSRDELLQTKQVHLQKAIIEESQRLYEIQPENETCSCFNDALQKLKPNQL